MVSKVKSGQSKSSKQWLRQHFADSYVIKAKKEGYRCRAVYKLLEIQEKDKLLRPGMTVVDLGAAPGGWSQITAEILQGKGSLIAVDILPMDPVADTTFIQGDFTTTEVLEQLLSTLDNKGVDVVLSDMAPNLSGMKSVDQPRSIYLAELALDFAKLVLKPEGCLLVKVFQGAGFTEFLQQLRENFREVKSRKPDASRDCSREVYLLAKGYFLAPN